MSEAVYKSMVQGVMMSLPRLRAPQHIVVLKTARKWYLASMLPECFKQPTMDMLLEAAYPEGDFDDGAGSSSAPATPAPPPPRVKEASSKRKQKATPSLQPGQQSLFNWKSAERQRTSAAELRKQREAALRNQDFEVETHLVSRFKSEEVEKVKALQAPR